MKKIDVLAEAYKDKHFIGLTIKKKDGEVATVNGKILEVRKSDEGHMYFLTQNYIGNKREDGSYFQNVRIDSIKEVRKNGKRYTK